MTHAEVLQDLAQKIASLWDYPADPAWAIQIAVEDEDIKLPAWFTQGHRQRLAELVQAEQVAELEAQ